ncbi:MAG: hypothetical protein E7649_04895 [Ruminococcaceae bacterium]|nr:hypothetical protein [Oscillospiraceae bacterium]
MRKRTLIIIIASVLVAAALTALIIVLIQNKNAQMLTPAPAPQGQATTEGESTNESTAPSFDSVEKSEGLAYQLSDDGESYIVVGLGNCNEKEVVIPEKYNNKPVSTIGDGAFEGSQIEMITFSANITKIGERAFAGCAKLEVILFYGDKATFNEDIEKASSWRDNCEGIVRFSKPTKNDYGVVVG